jgi:hypothetical protein
MHVLCGAADCAAAKGLLAEAYILTADFAVKLNDDPLSWMTADRALEAAQSGDDPLTLADARRAVATAMRRSGHADRACDLLLRACSDIDPESPDELAMYGSMLNVAAYTAVTGGRLRSTSGRPRQRPAGWGTRSASVSRRSARRE